MDSSAKMNFREMFMRIFQNLDPGGVLWQPRIEFWYMVNKKRGTLPEHLREASLLEVYDYCHASVRYFTNPLKVRYRNVHIQESWLDEKNMRRVWETPVGRLTETLHYDEWNISCYNSEYLLKTSQDFQVYKYILQDEDWYWDQEQYEQDLKPIGNRGVAQFYVRRSPMQSLYIETMGFEPTIYMLHDYPSVIEEYVEARSSADEAMYRIICGCPVPVFNFGENIDTHMDPPPVWRSHLLPYYTRRAEQIRASGKFTHIHIDGAMKPLIADIRSAPFDGIEAPTPLPQGDVTLEEIKTALGDKVLLDGIPAIYFLPIYPLDELIACTKRVVELFQPRLVLGISDEPPPDSDIERVRLIGELVQELA